MIISEDKPIAEILESIENHSSIFIVGCNTCAAKLHVGGEQEILSMKSVLENSGKKVVGWALPTAACSIRSWDHLAEKDRSINKADALLVMACGSGASVISKLGTIDVFPSNNTVSLGGSYKGEVLPDQCKMCGNCTLFYFGGICPYSQCPKKLLNGPCGGCSDDGACETDNDKECVWELIYKKLDEKNSLYLLERIFEPKVNK
ncbi:methylenetetrahydrofolate reductase C-terminal domain-containing protein [Methanosalsum natronophilum]|uniref:Methylene-tetrahydrofolate reductase C-terminal-like domain-containing protein n=1 Tax=Methanosalsum natronophilum TaxID=768733 RepID=A0A3R7YIL2_9EURY|nr:methylenetetrahydrofolate reductase C-terminal domain-containing protein [Methanosalsum natronophilum]MCS3924352.1 hypothetical protein [Methanosalsum natronophilum]RQD85516.1 MAG: hypothetical protein D5R95_04535 [Methanosalsum natronophilum]